jgi:hypothetical protein
MEMAREIEAAEEYSAADNRWSVQQKRSQSGTQRAAKLDRSRLDRDGKTPSRLAFQALEGANFMTGLSRLDAGQPHRLAALGTRKNSDLRVAV